MSDLDKVSPRPNKEVLALMPLPLSVSESPDGFLCLIGADGRWLAQVSRQVIEEFALRINNYERLVEALENFVDWLDTPHNRLKYKGDNYYADACRIGREALAAVKESKESVRPKDAVGKGSR